MQNVIQFVFSNIRHRWCLWHILKKLSEKFRYYDNKGLIFGAIHKLVYDSKFIQEFEEGCMRTEVLDFLFIKTSFWVGMLTTQRSESMNAFFNEFVHSKTLLNRYEQALCNKVEEFQANFKSFFQMLPCATQYEMEQQFQSIYTISKSKKPKAEFTEKVYCDLISTSEGNLGKTYECHLFEFWEIICRHAITVLICSNITLLRERCIIRRWRKDVSRAHMKIVVNYDNLFSNPKQLRYDDMCRAFEQCSNFQNHDSVTVRDSMSSCTKEVPKKLRRKGPLELSLKKCKVH
ncbi:protein FAR-RED ELONGATED HYPOCOTYL 3-like [Olea europaea var. sylvestris]|uniref:protein FAR-RED ELONGATED HYPOCOTYL 3-like n=1 Tax=Olea europaea var. sylvestris TaxID=158386 RepID=UPI000C1CCD8C|nr:protein FAR-RED ELONGATED HYPOCOTYL 3-like [Olea europaea var. sylvestris]